MSVEIISSFDILMQFAHTLGQTRLNGNENEIKKCEDEFNSYKQVCLDSDKISLNHIKGDLYV